MVRLRSVAGLVIQDTGRMEFEDGLSPEAMRRSFVTDSASTSEKTQKSEFFHFS